MLIRFKTNLDEPKECGDLAALNRTAKGDFIPRKGDRIFFAFEKYDQDGWPRSAFYELEVCSVSLEYDKETGEPAATIELHIPSYYSSMSISDWSNWFKRHRLSKS